MIIVGILLVLIVIILLVGRVVLRKLPKVQAAITKVMNKIFFNAIIRFLFQSTLKMQIAAATVIALATDEPTTSSLGILIAFNLIPFIFAVLLLCMRGKL